MITKINNLKSSTTNENVKALCETSIAALSSIIYNNVTPEAKYQIQKVTIEKLFDELSKYKDDKIVNEWLTNQERVYYIKNIGVKDSINNLLLSEGKYHSTLNGILNQYKEKLDDEVPEVMLYESFISAASGFSYLPAVNTELGSIRKRAKKYELDIDIEKIVETMKETKSNYLIPLIEDVVNNYLSNKNEQTKHMLKETLVKFSYDPFIRDIINVLILDATDLQLEYANESVNINKVYSPLVYLGENECLFNIKNSYYVKKGNTINKVKKDDVVKLNKDFVNLCESLNLSNVVINKDVINVYYKSDKAQITDKEVKINEQAMDQEQLRNFIETSKWMGNTDFYLLTEMLKNNFNEIAEVDFAKRVTLKENGDYAADVFKLRDNIFITTFDPIHNKNTFYKNINPIQAEKIMMEHMRFDVSKTFTDILPNKEKILSQIKETKKEYADYIILLENKINEFKLNNYKEDLNKAVIDTLQEELDEVKDEYKDYLNGVEKYVRPSGESLDEAISITLNVDGKKYEVPIPQEAAPAKGETRGDQTGELGTEVGAENVTDQQPASAITFDDENTELLGDSPTIPSDEVNLGAEETAEEVEDLEKEKKEKEKLSEPQANGAETTDQGTSQVAGEETTSTEEKPEGEAGGETFDIGTEETGKEEGSSEDELNVNDIEEEKPKEEDEEETEEEKKKKKTEESLQRTSYVKEEVKKPMKVYLKRKK